MTIADAPTPRRTRRPRWLDARVVGGVLLLVASVVVGAKVIGASSRTGPVWAAAKDLAAGTVLAPGDLVKVDVNLGDAGAAYLNTRTEPDGQMLNRPVTSGELLPGAALGRVGDGRIVSVSVSPDRMAPGVTHGSVIDLYLTSGEDRASGTAAATRLLRSGVTVQRVTEPAAGGLSAATSNHYQVALLLAPTVADVLVRALPSGDPLVVLHTGGSAGPPGAAGSRDGGVTGDATAGTAGLPGDRGGPATDPDASETRASGSGASGSGMSGSGMTSASGTSPTTAAPPRTGG